MCLSVAMVDRVDAAGALILLCRSAGSHRRDLLSFTYDVRY